MERIEVSFQNTSPFTDGDHKCQAMEMDQPLYGNNYISQKSVSSLVVYRRIGRPARDGRHVYASGLEEPIRPMPDAASLVLPTFFSRAS